MKHHLQHLLMCAPMIVVAGVLLASGAGVTAVVPVAACMLMMVVMMRGMEGHGSHSDDAT